MVATICDLREQIAYDPITGALTWRVSRPGVRAGSLISYRGNQGYIRVTFRRGYYSAHRIAWALHYGEWPTQTVDHVNGQRDDNRLCNLRLATRQQQTANMGKQSRNTSGFKGVSRHQGRWIAILARKFIGSYASPEEAHAAYVRAARERYGDFACDGRRVSA